MRYRGKHRYPRIDMFLWHSGLQRDMPGFYRDQAGTLWFTNEPARIAALKAGKAAAR